jgi:hypothetical protein
MAYFKFNFLNRQLPSNQSSLNSMKIGYMYRGIQGVSEIRVLILSSGRTRQFIKLFSITFNKIRKNFPNIFCPQFHQTSRFV